MTMRGFGMQLRRAGIALGAFTALALLAAAPASADRGRHWHSSPARVGVFVGLPPFVLVAGGPPRYADPYRYDDYRYDPRERAYDRGYEDGYDDGYGDRGREEWRRRHYRDRRCGCD